MTRISNNTQVNLGVLVTVVGALLGGFVWTNSLTNRIAVLETQVATHRSDMQVLSDMRDKVNNLDGKMDSILLSLRQIHGGNHER